VYRHHVSVVRVDAVAGSGYHVVVETLCRRIPGVFLLRVRGDKGFLAPFVSRKGVKNCIWGYGMVVI